MSISKKLQAMLQHKPEEFENVEVDEVEDEFEEQIDDLEEEGINQEENIPEEEPEDESNSFSSFMSKKNK